MHFLIYYFVIITAVYGSYRLPQNAVPQAYEVTIQINSDYFISERIKGTVNITLEIVNETNSIQIHAHSLTGFNFTLSNSNKTFKLTNNIISDAKDILTIESETVLSKGTYNLFGSYEGSFTQDLTGLYIPRNKTNGKYFMVATQMGLTEARKIFPCFDEPQYKATFQFTIMHPENYQVFSNTKINSSHFIQPQLNVARFEKTPIMSTYLNAFIMSNFTCDSVSDYILYRVCSRDETKSDRKFALDIAPKFVKFLENFTDFPYNKSSINKVDLITLPEFKYGGMENWGLITFREKALFFNEKFSSALDKQNVALIVAHELSHMWFGNLVTCEWWSDVFLNEGLAKYFEYLTAKTVFPDWELDEQFVVNVLHTILRKDAYKNIPALSSKVESPEEILGKINQISYLKGASVVRMLANTIGLHNFKTGIQEYIKQYQFKNVLAENFWSSFKNTSLPHNVSEIMENWVYQPGYPVVNVKLNKKDVTVTQERFLLNGSSPNSTKWYIPITYNTSNNANLSQLWLTPKNELMIKNVILNKSDWIICNYLQTGYYRVNYDDTLWDRIKKVLQTNHKAINVVNRAQIVDDLFNLAKAGKVSYRKVLEITTYLEHETDYYPWYSASRGFSELLPRISNFNQTTLKMKMHILNLLKNLYNSTAIIVSADSGPHIFSLKQSLAVKLACNLDHPDCVNESKALFESFKKDIRLRNNLGFEILCTSLRHSSNIEQDWNLVYKKFQASNIAKEEETFLLALACTTNATLLEKLLVSSFVSGKISKIYIDQLLSAIIASPTGLDTAIDFFVKYYDQIYCTNNNNDLFMKKLISVLSFHFTNETQINRILKLLNHPTVSNDIANHLDSALQTAKDRLNADKNLNKELLKYFDNPNSTSKLTMNLVLLLVSYYFSRCF